MEDVADTELLEAMFRGKTGALIRAAVELPAHVRPATEAERLALADFGDAIGVAFQVIDDLLDVKGSTEQLGKPAGSDVERGKASSTRRHYWQTDTSVSLSSWGTIEGKHDLKLQKKAGAKAQTYVQGNISLSCTLAFAEQRA